MKESLLVTTRWLYKNKPVEWTVMDGDVWFWTVGLIDIIGDQADVMEVLSIRCLYFDYETINGRIYKTSFISSTVLFPSIESHRNPVVSEFPVWFNSELAKVRGLLSGIEFVGD
jgi:hypothetical protein